MDYNYLKKIRSKLLNIYKYADKYKKKRMAYDFSNFNQLVLVSGFPNLVIPIEIYDEANCFAYRVYEYLEDFEVIADEVIDMFKETNFFLARNAGAINFSKKDLDDISKEFLLGFSADAYKLYEDLIREKRVFDFEKKYLAGEAYILTESNLAFIGKNDHELANTLFPLATMVHELMHIYVEFFLKNYRYTATFNSMDGFYAETIPMYSELEFYKFLVNNHLCGDSKHFNANYNDYIRLSYYKRIKYIVEMARRDDANVTFFDAKYEISGNTSLEIETNNPVFTYSSNYEKGSLNPFVYAMSLLDAYKLLEQSDNGDKNIINNYLISLQDPDKLEKDIINGYDLSFMRDDIKRHCDEIIKIYQKK
ncbi:MAG: hypothetical protein J1F35_04115 [Erysipelotrichales bacterium]|nr:hypothetical protein [Erysipelotrichales bacterium]